MSFFQRLRGSRISRFYPAIPLLLLLCCPLAVTADQDKPAEAVAAAGSDPCDKARRHDNDGADDHSAHDPHRNHRMPTGLERSQASYAVPDVTLTNQEGKPLALSALLATDRPVLLNFIFTSCTAICPAMSATFTSVQDQLGSDSDRILMISVSIDPEHDTPEALAEYAQRFRAGPQWQFLTGSLDDSIAVQRAFDADRGDKMNHAPLTLLRATSGSDWVRYEGFARAADLAQEARSMLEG